MCKGKKHARVKEIGQGAFGHVDLYEAIDGSGSKIAVKIAKGKEAANIIN